MTIGITEEQSALADAVSGWAARHAPPAVTRKMIDGEQLTRPEHWSALAEQGLLGLHLPELLGGSGGTAVDQAVSLDRCGHSLVPGPLLPTVIVSTALHLAGEDERIGGLADGRVAGGLAVAAGLDLRAGGTGLIASGRTGPVFGADADVLLLGGVDEAGCSHWFLVPADDVTLDMTAGLDPSRPLAEVTVADLAVQPTGLTTDLVHQVAAAFAAAEAAGLASWCLETATEHAKVREQFGRPIGQFQAVKHTCARMLVRVEKARAAAWDAARALPDPDQRPLAVAVAAATALEAAVDCAKDCIQVLGGIGFTWEHDAHLYLRRAVALRQLFGPAGRWRSRAAELALGGVRRTLGVELPASQTASVRATVQAFLTSLDGLDERGRRRRIADSGYLQPHWPEPWGLGADPTTQLVIDEEFAAAGVARPDLVIGGWVLPTLIAHGSESQQQRFIPPTLHGDLTWCQLFSEPGAGSDLASLATKATRADGGWVLNGQKVWTSVADRADWGLCLARTDGAAAKHQGITCFLVDMRAEGLDIRPLREITGRALFSEVFLNDVFVPDDCVVGAVNDGWRVGRTTLANERVAMSSGSTMGAGVEGVLRVLAHMDRDPVLLDRAGALVCDGQVLALLGLRTTLRKLSGLDPGAASSVRKLVGMEHAQECAELALELFGPAGATAEGPAAQATFGFLQSRCLTIAGGTTEVQRNVVAERILGLPRDDEPAL